MLNLEGGEVGSCSSGPFSYFSSCSSPTSAPLDLLLLLLKVGCLPSLQSWASECRTVFKSTEVINTPATSVTTNTLAPTTPTTTHTTTQAPTTPALARACQQAWPRPGRCWRGRPSRGGGGRCEEEERKMEEIHVVLSKLNTVIKCTLTEK